jgi:AcrR family transcriptional regulator
VIDRRGEAVRQAVLAAALAELAERGYAAFVVENVAARAGVHKTTVYRRWPDRETLLTDAVLEQAVGDFEVPDTGDIDADLRVWVQNLAAWLTGPAGAPLVSMLRSDASRLPAVVEAKIRFFAARATVMAQRLGSAINRGQLPTGTDPLAFLATPVAPSPQPARSRPRSQPRLL